MKLKDICKKLVKANINSYKILLFCLILGTMLFTSYGLLIFSPTITDVISDGGSTQMIAYSIYVAFSIACLVFILYSHSLFMKYKSREIGVFISLGINRKNVKDILLKELNYILPLACTIGMILALPFTYIVWTFIKTIAGTIDNSYQIGWLGFVGGTLFSLMSIKCISVKTSLYIKKVDIMKILKSNDNIEDVKGGNYKFGIIGLFLIPTGVIGANLNMRGVLFSSVDSLKYIFFLMVILGLYFVCASFTSIGEFIKKTNKKKYYKNIMFYNLLKLKGKQYTSTLFTVTALIAITMFTMCFSFINVIAKEEMAEKLSPFDFSIVKSENQNTLLTKDVIDELASENDVLIKVYNEIEMLTIAYNFTKEEVDKYGFEVDPERAISESDYNKLYNENIDVNQGMYYIAHTEKSSLEIDRYQSMELSSLGSDKKQLLKKQEGLFKQILNGEQVGILILDDKDYETFKSESPSDAVETVVCFNVANWNESYEFYKELENWVIENNRDGLLMYGSAFERIYFDMDREYISANEVSKTDYRDWPYKVNSKIYMATDMIEIEMTYPLLFGYIALLSLIASAMILYIKVLNTSWQDSNVYQSISLLGANKKLIKSIITKQLAIIFIIPTVVGLSLGVMIEIVMTGQGLTASIYRNYALLFSTLFALVQTLVFVLARNVILKKSYNKRIKLKNIK